MKEFQSKPFLVESFNFTVMDRKSDNEEIHQLKKQIKTLETLKNNAEQANQLKSEFIANITHDLRNPITSILGFSELLIKGEYGKLTQEQIDQLRIIFENAQHAKYLINQVLDLSKIQYQKVQISLSEFSIIELCQHVAKSFDIQLKEKKLIFDLDIDSNCDKVYSDREKIIDILANLLNNAIIYTEIGGKIGIKAENNGSMCEISIWDTGIGIQEEDFYSLFQPFSRILGDQQNTPSGTGLGLYHTKQLVESLNGTIIVESSAHMGSKFIISVPIRFDESVKFYTQKIGAFFFGLNLAGKTSIINSFQNIPTKSYKPTMALVITRFSNNGQFYELVDCPGQQKLRKTWEQGLELAKCLVFVLDMADSSQYNEAYSEFQRILSLKTTEGMPVVVLFHKIDLKIPLSDFQKSVELFNRPMPSHKLFFFQTSIKMKETLKGLQKVIEELLYQDLH